MRDGEGATKFITVQVEGGKTEAECGKVAYAIAHSPLVKTAFFASDPNLGRMLCAIGYAGIADLDVGRVELYLGDVLVAKDGGRNPAYREEDGQRVMQQSEITVRVELGRGAAADHGVDLRSVARLRVDQRRLPQLMLCMTELSKFLERAEALVARLEVLLPAVQPPVDWNASIAFRWRKAGGHGHLQPVVHPHKIRLSDLSGVDGQKQLIEQNTRQFVAGCRPTTCC